MPWNGSGVFNRIYSWVADAAAGIDITASRTDTDTSDITANGFGNCITRDGQGSASANQPMNGFRHTGVGNGQASTDYAALGQVQAGTGLNWSVASGSSDAITAIYTPSLTALVDGQLCFFRATAANATTTPTFAPNGLTAHTITKEGGAALVAGDIAGDLAEVILRYNLSNTRWELLNPMSDIDPTTGWGLTTSSEVFSVATSNPPFGFDMPINLQLNASVGSNLLTIAVKGNNGSDPSATNPVLIPFRDSTIANGDPVWVAVTSALSISTNSTGATLGVPAANTPFRYWVMAFNNSGTVVLALINASTWTSTTAQIFPLNESGVASTTAIGAAATSAGVFYTPNGTTLSNCAFRIIGYVEYNAGLSTNGTFASAPTSIQLFGPGVRKPGDIVQSKRVQATSAATTTSAGFTGTNLTTTFALASSINMVRIKTAGSVGTGGATTGAVIVVDTTDSVNIGLSLGIAGAAGTTMPVTTSDFYQPKSTASKTYNVQIASDGTHTVTYPQGTASSGSYMELDEVMG